MMRCSASSRLRPETRLGHASLQEHQRLAGREPLFLFAELLVAARDILVPALHGFLALGHAALGFANLPAAALGLADRLHGLVLRSTAEESSLGGATALDHG